MFDALCAVASGAFTSLGAGPENFSGVKPLPRTRPQISAEAKALSGAGPLKYSRIRKI